jgi:alpha 1,3-glucosidase
MWMQYPKVPELYSVDDQYLIGSDLLVKPVTSAGATTSQVLFPLADCWYDVDTMQVMKLPGGSGESVAMTVDSGMDKIPVFQRGGSIIPRKLRLRRSSYLMINDPYTLYVALDNELKAKGVIYMDDETTFDHESRNEFGVATFTSDLGSSIIIQNSVELGGESALQHAKDTRMIERIVVMGATKPNEIELTHLTSSASTPIEFQYDEKSKILIIRKPEVSALEQWSITFKG